MSRAEPFMLRLNDGALALGVFFLLL